MHRQGYGAFVVDIRGLFYPVRHFFHGAYSRAVGPFGTTSSCIN